MTLNLILVLFCNIKGIAFCISSREIAEVKGMKSDLKSHLAFLSDARLLLKGALLNVRHALECDSSPGSNNRSRLSNF